MNELDKALDLTPAPLPEIKRSNVPAVIDKNKDPEIEEAKAALDELIEIGKDAIEDAAVIAKQSQHPQAIDSLGKLLKTVSDLHMKKVAISKNKPIKQDGTVDEGAQTVNNTTQQIFVGTTAELAKMIEEFKNKDV
jgi:predicted methyltransferase